MLALYKLQAKGYFSNMFNKIEFFTTIMFLAVLGSMIIFKTSSAFGGSANLDNQEYVMMISKLNITIISSIALMMIMNSAMQSFGLSFFEMKESVLLKRIGATKISKFEAVSSFLLWGLTTMLITMVWMSIWVGICQIPSVAEATNGLLYVDGSIWKGLNYGGMIVAIIITALAFYAISFLFVSFSKNAEMFQIMSTFYFFVAVFLGGTFSPSADREWMTIIGYLSPLGWGTSLMSNSALQGFNQSLIEHALNNDVPNLNIVPIGIQEGASANVFNFSGYYIFDEINTMPGAVEISFEHVGTFYVIGDIIFPMIYGILAALASMRIFKWD